jgi:PAS domain S-box-containing protein
LKSKSRSTVVSYLLALVAVLAAAGLHGFLLNPLLGGRVPFAAFATAILVTAWFGGFGPGIFATLLSTGIGLATFEVPIEIQARSEAALGAIFLIVGGLISGVCGTLRRSKLRAEESEERFRLMANGAPVMIWMSDSSKDCTWFNRPWLEFTGRTLEQEKGAGWTKGVHPDDLEECLTIYTSHFDVRRPFEMEYRLRRYDGEYRWILDRGTPLDSASGQFNGFIGSCIDITDRKEAERERDETLFLEHLAREEAERMARYKDEFVATLSHELRTPLNAILGWTQLLSKARTPENISEAVEVIRRNARAQAELIGDLLEVSQSKSGKIRLEQRLINLSEIVRTAVSSARPAADAKQIALYEDIEQDGLTILGDSHRLQQIIGNLLSNALKFTPSEGTVSVILTADRTNCRISVRDSGQGIKPEFLPRVFDLFQQQDGSTTRRQPGLGIGLALVKDLVSLHGGSVHAESAGEGFGATFTVIIPRQMQSLPQGVDQLPSQQPLPSLEGISVVVVEDDVDSRNFLRQILEQNGAHVMAACSVRVALDMIKSDPPDLLVSDIAMSKQDGIDLIHKIRDLDSPDHCLPAIAVTALAGESNRRRILEAGFQTYLTKPVDVEKLIRQADLLARRKGSRRDTLPSNSGPHPTVVVERA